MSKNIGSACIIVRGKGDCQKFVGSKKAPEGALKLKKILKGYDFTANSNLQN
jgi:hypothetical protein